MRKSDVRYTQFVSILKEELLPAMGCTEPDGIVKHGVEKTIEPVGKLARHGMRATDEEIIRLMLED